MRCPYCAEHIHDDAVVCRYCGRDFQLLAPLMRKVHEVEERLATLERHSRHETTPAPDEAAVVAKESEGRGAEVVLSEALLYAVAFASVLAWHMAVEVSPAVEFLSVFCGPTLLGVFFGYKWGTRNLVPLGLTVFLVTFLLSGIDKVPASGAGASPDAHFVYSLEVLWRHPISFVFIAGVTILLCSLTAAGDWLFRRTHPEIRRAGIAGKVARGLTRRSSTSHKERMEQIERKKAALVAYAPLLALLGTILGSVLTFFGMIYRPKW